MPRSFVSRHPVESARTIHGGTVDRALIAHCGGAPAHGQSRAEVTIPSWPTPPSPVKIDGAGYEGAVGGQTRRGHRGVREATELAATPPCLLADGSHGVQATAPRPSPEKVLKGWPLELDIELDEKLDI